MSEILINEHVADIPLLLGLMQELRLADAIDTHIGTHGAQQGVSHGVLACLWLTYILSEGDHAKYHVQDWIVRHQHTLTGVLGTSLRPTEGTDDRLTQLLTRLDQDAAWEALETALWQSTALVYTLEPPAIRLDSTTVSGHHLITDDGVMQFGHSKDHRPDLPQLKLMVAAADPTGLVLASTLHPGSAADDPLYRPLAARVHALLGRSGLLFIGDAKMAAQETRAQLVSQQDHYVTSCPEKQLDAGTRAALITRALLQEEPLTEVWRGHGEQAHLLGVGFEVTRPCHVVLDEQTIDWTERIIVLHSQSLARQQLTTLASKLELAEAALARLTPPPKRGVRVYREEATLQEAVQAILARYGVAELLTVTLQEEPTRRGGRWRLARVLRAREALAAHMDRLGWSVLLTDLSAAQTPLDAVVWYYRDGWRLESRFHELKDHPVGIAPLLVHRDDQLRGLTRLLVLALYILTLLRMRVQQGLLAEETAVNVYPGQPTQTTNHPTGGQILKLIGRAHISLLEMRQGDTRVRILTPLPDVVQNILRYIQVSERVYTQLSDPSRLE